MRRLLLVATLLLAACADDYGTPSTTLPAKGPVVALVYDDEDRWFETVTESHPCYGIDGKLTVCSSTHQEERVDPPHWWVRVYDEATDRLVSVEVPQAVYTACRKFAQFDAATVHCLG